MRRGAKHETRLHLDQLNYWQELYVRRGVTPKYDLVQIEGQVHEPTFKYRGKPKGAVKKIDNT